MRAADGAGGGRGRSGVAAAAVAASLLLPLLFTWPLVRELGRSLAGWGGDNFMFAWDLWWVRKALLGGGGIHDCPLLLAPLGADLSLHTLTPANGLLALPLIGALGLLPAFNLLLLLSFPAAFWATWLLARREGLGPGGAAIAGLVFAYAPYKTAQGLAHFNMAHTVGLPLTAWALLRALERRRLRDGALLGAVVAGSAYLALVYGLLAATLVGLLLVTELPGLLRRHGTRRRAGTALLAAGVTALLLLAPQLAAMRAAGKQWDYPRNPASGAVAWSADPIAWITPPVFSTLWGRPPGIRADGSPETWIDLQSLWRTPWGQPVRITGDIFEGTLFLGYSVLLVAGIGLWGLRRERRLRRWLVVLAVAALLSLGPVLHLNGRLDFGGRRIPLPFALLQRLPGAELFRMPAKLHLLVMLALALLAGRGAERAARAMGKRPVRRAALFGLLGLLVLLEYLPLPYPRTRIELPGYLAALAELPPGTVMDLPLGWRSGLEVDATERTAYQLFQTIHGRPMVTGHVSRIPREPLRYFHGLGVIEDLYRLGLRGADPRMPLAAARAQARAVCRLWNLRAVVLHRRALLHHVVEPTAPPERLDALAARLEETFPVRMVYDDGDARLYAVRPPAVKDPERLDLTAPGSRVALLAGLEPRGSEGAWAVASRALLLLPPRPDGASFLALEARAPASAPGGVAVELLLHGRTLGRLRLTRAWSTTRLALPPRRNDGRPEILELRHEPGSSGRRRAGLRAGARTIAGYRSVRYEP